MTHPARFSPQIIDALRPILAGAPHIHDPFAGTGERLGALCDELGVTFSGTEIEKPFIVDKRVVQGDSRHFYTYPCQTLTVEGMIPYPFWIVTSPSYANGMNDNFKPSGICSICEGVGGAWINERDAAGWYESRWIDCLRCNGTGGRPIKRYTYRAALIEATGDPDAALTDGNTGAHGYRSGRKAAERYWQLNREVVAQWGHAERVIVNVSDFYMRDERIEIVGGWGDLLRSFGWKLTGLQSVETPRMRNGANSGRRAEHEAIIIAERNTPA